MTEKLQKVECPCGFVVQSHDEGEIVDLIRTHAKQAHGHEFSESEIRQAMKPSQAVTP